MALVVAIFGAAPAYAADAAGTISGHITTSSGAPADRAQVLLLFPSGVGYREKLAEPDGSYEFTDVSPGDYKLAVSHDGVHQYAHRKLGFAEADTFTVEDGGTTVIDEKMFEPGAIEAKVVDAVSGLPVETACLTLWYEGPETCTPQNGVFRFTGLGRKSDYMIDARADDGLHMRARTSDIAVEIGQTTQVTIKLDPAAAITTRVLDRTTREPVSYACVSALSTYFGGIENGSCAESSDEPTAESAADGTVRIGEIPAGERRLFVQPNDGVHGIQWVGAAGGTGSQYSARKINAIPGKMSTVAPILLDPQASLSGTFVAAAGGPLETTSFCATVMPGPEQGLPPGSSCGSADGTFTISGLGPYRWPVGFTDPWGSAYGVQWPGGSDRSTAPTYQVTAGTKRDIGTKKIVKGRTLSGRILHATGQPVGGYHSVMAFNARTGDYLGQSWMGADYRVEPLIGQDVKLRITSSDQLYSPFWYENASAFPAGRAVHIRSNHDKNLDITVPQP
jgi:hypothetical protein